MGCRPALRLAPVASRSPSRGSLIWFGGRLAEGTLEHVTKRFANDVTILAVGDVGLDISLLVDRLPAPDEKVHAVTAELHSGGVITNFASAASKLGSQVMLCARVGRDLFGQLVLRDLGSSGIDLTCCRVSDAIRTCFTVSIVDSSGEKRLVVVPTGGLYPELSQVPLSDGRQFAWCHTVPFDLERATAVAELARSARVPFSIDLEPGSLHEIPDRTLVPLVRSADTVFLNRRATALLGAGADEALARLHAAGVPNVVLTMGAQGAVLSEAAKTKRELAGAAVAVVDSTGAGDALAAAYVHRRIGGAGPLEAVRFGIAAGALACRALGARASQPDESEVLELLASRAPR